MNTKAAGIGLKGRVKVSVVDARGNTILERPWQKNLLLDQGLNQLALTPIADLFAYAAKGTDTTATKETVSTGNAYALVGATLTRTGGAARDFTAGDVGKLIRITTSPFTEGIIQAFTDINNVTLRAVGQTSLANYSNKDILIYSVNQVGLGAESGARTNTYGAGSADNDTDDAANVRTYTRTFLFDAEPEQLETPAGSNTYSRSGTTITKTAGARIFTANDVGKYIYFITDATLTKITAYTSGTQVTVADSGTIAAQNIKFYGFTAYGEIGFSHLSAAGNNLNIRVRLEDGGGASAPVVVEGANTATPGQQLKVTYELQVTVTPAASTPATASITDTGNDMSANKTGDYAVEAMALSAVNSDGDTNLDFDVLEPSVPGSAALSPVSTALAAFAGPDRGAGAAWTPLVNGAYTADSFTILSEGTFALNEAIGVNWRSMGIFDTGSEQFAFTFLFDAAQTKDVDHTLTLRFRKTWNRDLS